MPEPNSARESPARAIELARAAYIAGDAEECAHAISHFYFDDMTDAPRALFDLFNSIFENPREFYSRIVANIRCQAILEWCFHHAIATRNLPLVFMTFARGARDFATALDIAAWHGDCEAVQLVYQISGGTVDMNLVLSVAKYSADRLLEECAHNLGARDDLAIDLGD